MTATPAEPVFEPVDDQTEDRATQTMRLRCRACGRSLGDATVFRATDNPFISIEAFRAAHRPDRTRSGWQVLQVALLPDLSVRPGRIDGMVAYGPTDEWRRTGRQEHRRSAGTIATPPFLVYCVGRECNRKHVVAAYPEELGTAAAT